MTENRKVGKLQISWILTQHLSLLFIWLQFKQLNLFMNIESWLSKRWNKQIHTQLFFNELNSDFKKINKIKQFKVFIDPHQFVIKKNTVIQESLLLMWVHII